MFSRTSRIRTSTFLSLPGPAHRAAPHYAIWRAARGHAGRPKNPRALLVQCYYSRSTACHSFTWLSSLGRWCLCGRARGSEQNWRLRARSVLRPELVQLDAFGQQVERHSKEPKYGPENVRLLIGPEGSRQWHRRGNPAGFVAEEIEVVARWSYNNHVCRHVPPP
jgi:hypothetical protein